MANWKKEVKEEVKEVIVDNPQTEEITKEVVNEEEEKENISPVEIEIRKACGIFFATLQNISYIYGINPKETEDLAEAWIKVVNKTLK